MAADLIGIPHERCSVSQMVPINRLSTLMCFDIGLVPLADIPFNHAKSNLKGLEYAISGIPYVASALPEYQRLANEGIGRVAVTPDHWIEELTALLGRRNALNESQRNYTRVKRDHTIDSHRDEWLAALT